MQRKWQEILLALVLGFLCPAMLFSFKPKENAPEQEQTVQTTQEPSTTTQLGEFRLKVLTDDGSVNEMEMNEYLVCVVLREMPAEFEKEALKAQAVVARTYALRRYHTGGKHNDASVCTDSSCCQGFCTREEFLDSGGSVELLEKVEQAVSETSDLVLVYKGELIEATYFSCSGGMTEDAKAVWGSDIPYLQSVESPGEEEAARYVDTVSYSVSEFERMLGTELPGSPVGWVESITYTEGGGVDTMRLCGKDFKGTTLRQLLGLRSTAFIMTAVGDTVTITTKGFGHRVGMSQYGADAMAVKGSSYGEILAHYYQNVELVTYSE